MKLLVLVLSLIFLSACSSTQQTSGVTLPELVYQYPLPAFPKPLSSSPLRIDLKIFINENGSVREVELQNSSGSLEWDSAAVKAIHQWKYSPARYEDKPVSIWLRQTAIVKFSDPLYLLLGEIQFNSKEEADSAFMLLETGTDFSEIVLKYSVDSSRMKNGSLGAVNIQIFPEHIKNVLLKLKSGDHTAPIKHGEQFAIFKRLKE